MQSTLEPISMAAPIQLAPMCDDDTDPGVLETTEHNDGFLLCFDGDQHRTELNESQIKDLAEQKLWAEAGILELRHGLASLLSREGAQELRDRIDAFLSK